MSGTNLKNPLGQLAALSDPDAPPNAASALDPALVTLDGFSSLLIEGEEALSFVQGQFSNDVEALTNDHGQLTSYCNPKGRALSVFWLLKSADSIRLLMPSDIAPLIEKRLNLYKMRAKLTITLESTDQLVLLTDPQNSISKSDFTGAAAQHSWTIDGHRVFLQLNAGHLNQLAATHGLAIVSADYLKLLQIYYGEPMIYPATSESLIPQHMNLDLAQGVSFTKGCYPGQEIIARLRYLGKLKQRMISGWVKQSPETLNLSPGDSVYTDASTDKRAGIIIDVVNAGELCVVSVNVPASHIASGDVLLGSSDGPALQRLELPYEISLERS